MKKYFILIIILILLITGCLRRDPLARIKRLTKVDIQKKEKQSKEYKEAIDTIVDAYRSLGGLNKSIGEYLMINKSYKEAIKHLEIAKDIRNEDATIYYWLGVCNVNLYKIEGLKEYLSEAEKNYKIALKIMPDHLDILYGYAHLLVYGKNDYAEAEKVLKKYIELEPVRSKPDPKAYFLLGRVYYLMEDYEKAYETYNKILKFKKDLTNKEKNKLDEFIMESAREMQGE